LEILKRWKFDTNLTSQFANYLTVQGWNDLKYMAIDYQKTFQNVIDHDYRRDKFRFAHSDTQRTYASFKAFAEGLFGPGADRYIDVNVGINSSFLLRPYENCPEFEHNEEQAKAPDSEHEKFKDTEIYRKTAEEISSRLGFKYILNPNQIQLMFDMCRYDQAWYLQDESAWCSAFTPEHINVLEYLEDLDYYVQSSYGSPTNSKIMCAAVKDMAKFMLSEDNPRVSAYFSHASAIQLFLTAIGYAKDDKPLRADNYREMKNRKFRTSVLSPLASNLAVVKYE
jgi:multiple inositol-polyphosphate phosphatase / 2,3-bisphosphoglycerate 3-phosphatase